MNATHVFTAADGSLLGEFSDFDQASRFRKKLERDRTPYSWSSWGGARTGWNSVAGSGIEPAHG